MWIETKTPSGLHVQCHDEPGRSAAEYNVDAIVTLADGQTVSLTAFTTENIRSLLLKWKDDGDATEGLFFRVPDAIIIPEPTLAALLKAIDKMYELGELRVMS